MKKYLPVLCTVTALYGFEDTIIVTAPKIEITDNFISIEDSQNKKDQTLESKLINDVSYVPVKDYHNNNSVSFRGIKSTATNVIEDLIPSYRTSGGNIDFYYDFNMYEMSSNMLIRPSSLGVSSMGSDIELFSKKQSSEYEGELSTNISQNDNQQKIYLGVSQKDFFLQFFANRYDRDDYKLSNNFITTLEQPSKDRLNSDNYQQSYEIKSGYNLNDKDSISIKYKNSKSDFGIEPNVYDGSSWSAYTRMEKKDLQSLYGYYDHKDDNIEINTRIYYDRYKDIWAIYNDNSYRSHWPLSTYDDTRLGMVLKAELSQDKDELAFVLNVEDNEHIWKEIGRNHQPAFEFRTINSSIIGKKVYDNITVNGAITNKRFKPLKVDFDGDPSFTQTQTGAKNDSMDYQIGLNHLKNNGLWYLAHSKTTKIPTMSEMFTFFPWDTTNTDLKVESSINYEVGYRRFLESGLYSLGVFHYNIKDKIVYENNKYINLNKAVHKGAEFRYENIYFDKHNLNLSYLYTRAKDGDNKDLELIPKSKVIISDKIDIDNNYSVNIQYIYLSKRKDNTNSGAKTISSYSLVNLYMSADLSNDLEATVGVKNLLDKNYQSAYGYPNEGRNVYGQVKWKF